MKLNRSMIFALLAPLSTAARHLPTMLQQLAKTTVLQRKRYPWRLGKVMTFGTGTGAGAMCTDFTKGSKDTGKTNAASCNALLKAAGKC